MTQDTAIKLFNDKQIRTLWDNEKEKWFFSIVDVIGVLTESPNPLKYWSVLKTRLKAEESQLATNCSQLKMQSSDGKFYKTDVANTKLAKGNRLWELNKAKPHTQTTYETFYSK